MYFYGILLTLIVQRVKIFLSLIWFYLAWICTRSITGLVTFDTETQLKNKCTSIMYLKCIIKNVFVFIFFI